MGFDLGDNWLERESPSITTSNRQQLFTGRFKVLTSSDVGSQGLACASLTTVRGQGPELLFIDQSPEITSEVRQFKSPNRHRATLAVVDDNN